MTSNPELNDTLRLPLGQLAQECAAQSERYFQRQDSDPSYCYELLRRAILERQQQAWTLFYNQYRPLVASWVLRHPAFVQSGEEVQYFVNSAYEKFWSALSPAKFEYFPDLKGLLRYLQTCVHSVIIDQIRLAEHRALPLNLDVAPAGSPSMIDRAAREEFWRWLEARLNNEKERRVIYGSFFLDLKPRELYAEFNTLFRDVGEVHRVKENVLARLRRDPELRAYFSRES
jgi:DNA-directed RNA polymerase specialized sigma24 family protein